MKVFIDFEENYGVMENCNVEPENTINWSNFQINALKKLCMKEKTTLYLLYQAVDESCYKKIVNAKSAKKKKSLEHFREGV